MANKKFKIANYYCCIGGNRKLIPKTIIINGETYDVEVTGIEIDPIIAAIYQDFYPEDKVIIGDAHQHMLEHFEEFDFIWSSPPCPTHSRIRQFSAVARGQNDACFPDMKLYEEIIFLMHNFKGLWVVENVISYYEPLIKPQELGGNYFWSNYNLGNYKDSNRCHNGTIEELQQHKGFDLSKYEGIDKVKTLRNLVEPLLARHIFNMAFKTKQVSLKEMI